MPPEPDTPDNNLEFLKRISDGIETINKTLAGLGSDIGTHIDQRSRQPEGTSSLTGSSTQGISSVRQQIEAEAYQTLPQRGGPPAGAIGADPDIKKLLQEIVENTKRGAEATENAAGESTQSTPQEVPSTGTGGLFGAARERVNSAFSAGVGGGVGGMLSSRLGMVGQGLMAQAQAGASQEFHHLTSPGELQQYGAMMGYDVTSMQGGILPNEVDQTWNLMGLGPRSLPIIGDVPFQVPGTQLFTPAGRYALTQQLQALSLGIQTPNLSTDEVRNVQGQYGMMGWSGAAQGEMSYATSRVLSDQPGLDPGTVTSFFDQSLRHGTVGLSEVAASLDDIGLSAQGSRMNMNEFIASMTEAGNEVQNLGGRFHEGAVNARQYADATGMDPAQYGRSLQSPFVQAGIHSQLGLVPGTEGLAPQGAVMGIENNMMEMMMGQMRGTFRDREIDMGGYTDTITGTEQAAGVLAPMFGMTTEQFLRRYRGRRRAQALSDLGGHLESFQRRSRSIEDLVDADRITQEEGERRQSRLYEGTGGRRHAGGADIEGLIEDAPRRLRGRLERVWNQEGMSPSDRVERMQTLMRQHGADRRQRSTQEPEVRVGLTREARRLLQIVGRDRRSDAVQDQNKGKGSVSETILNGPARDIPAGGALGLLTDTSMSDVLRTGRDTIRAGRDTMEGVPFIPGI